MKIKNRFISLVLLITSCCGIIQTTRAQELSMEEKFYKGKVTQISDSILDETSDIPQSTRQLSVEIETENGSVKRINLQENYHPDDQNQYLAEEGDHVVVSETNLNGVVEYHIFEPYRLPGLILIFIIFITLILLATGKKGIFALLGLCFTFGILVQGLIPQVLKGSDPLLLSFFASAIIAIITFYLSHGFKKRTHLALFSTLGTLILAFLLSQLAGEWAKLMGTGTEEALSLSFNGMNTIDLKGLILGAIVIGTLGVLDDVTITQVGTVHEIHEANRKLDYKELYKRAISVGRDHIASIINTLVLAYAGASFPTLILLASSPWPLWMTINNEFMAEEIVRTLVGSMTLIIAIPISTMLAAYIYSRRNAENQKINT